MNSTISSLVLLQAAGSTSGQMISTIVTFGLVFVIFYFLIIRPQNKKQKDAQKMIAAVKKGDKIVTIGGVHGTVYSVKETTVVVKVDDEARIEFSKSAIASVAARAEDKAGEVTIEKPAEKVEDKTAEAAAKPADKPAEKPAKEKK